MDEAQHYPERRITDPAGDGRRTSIEERMSIVEERMRIVDDKLDRLNAVEKKLDDNTALTQNVVDMFKTLEAGIRVLGGLGRIAQWLAPFVAIVATVWAMVNGKSPGK